ncbi:uncharacterized protein LOC131327330 [Rhododendron vialii]|uniref:uncharacterized protein LOC131327330 n=1 Tax=Rhododendron vialii TaxID=182163 RepID=UPI00265DA075|nr:uncharacterized protein LOC131327330 [Rhododendron vialii]
MSFSMSYSLCPNLTGNTIHVLRDCPKAFDICFVVREEMQVDGVEQMRETEKSLILFCKYNGLCAGIKLSRSSRIGDFMKILCGKFSELRRHSLQLFYAIRDHPSTMLYNDEDLEVMFAVADSIGLNCIEVTVVDSHDFDSDISGCGVDVGANSSGVFDSGGASTSKGICFSGQGLVGCRLESMEYVGKEDDLGAMFCSHQHRPRLLDAWKELIKSVGQLFVGGSEGFRDALRKYSIVHSFEFDFVKNETERVTAVCKVKSCKWNIHARLDKDDVRDKSKKRPVDVVDDLKEYYGVDVSVFDVEWDQITNHFLRLFVAFDACVQGFKHCRPVLSVDATFLKARHMGCLMSTSAKDGNAGLFPLGIKEGIAKVFPSSFHAYRLYHLKCNLRTALASTNVKYKEGLIRVFSKCAYTPTVAKFNQHMGNLLKHGGAAVITLLLLYKSEESTDNIFQTKDFDIMNKFQDDVK